MATSFVEQLPQAVELHFVAGDRFVFQTAPITVAGAALNLSAYTIVAQIRDASTGTLLLAPTVTVTGGGNNVIQFTLSETDTRTAVGAGRRAWGLEWTDGSGGGPRTVLAGTCLVDPEVVTP